MIHHASIGLVALVIRRTARATRLMTLTMLVIAAFPSLGIAQGAMNDPSIKNIVERVLPRKYPLLIKYAKKHRGFPVTWTTQSGETQTVDVHFEDKGLIVQGTIHTQSREGPKPVIVMMFDTNLDSRIDLVIYMGAAIPGGRYSKQDPRDDATLILWYTSLDAVIRFSKCC